MSTPRDDDALSWDGDDDPTLDVGHRPGADTAVADGAPIEDDEPAAESLALPDGYTAVGKGSAEVGRIEADGTVTMPDESAQLSNAMLVTVGILAGAYLLFTIGWIIGGLRLQGTAQFLVSPVGYTVAFWLAVAAPALWFLTVFVLTRLAKAWVRVLLLLGGLALLVPWPFILVGAVGR
ncbi:DNA polymerase III subunit gamma/tau [Microbacterium hominis]|uniref:DNA polymerase III subunit gamma/tau n=1 Tax=Microbacterium hominis TaxID=162426 RepID=UPI0019651462|nr:DNA polymerase III subunit gamma/tau [Microbacterium hominis]QRY40899.1 DNA polymerase III subunit gamma/tau [Microbacterium hominis]